MAGYSYWNKIRLLVLLRDNHTCSCGSKKRLAVHHRDGSGDNLKQKKANNKLNNLITLCQRCHVKEHWRLAKNDGRMNIYKE